MTRYLFPDCKSYLVSHMSDGRTSRPLILIRQRDTRLTADFATLETITNQLSNAQLPQYLESVFNLISEVNKYWQSMEPWKIDTSSSRRDTVVYVALESCRLVAISLIPVIPEASRTLLDGLGIKESRRRWQDLQFGTKEAGRQLGVTRPLFPKT